MKVTIRLPDEESDPTCPVRSILEQVGDKWTALVITYLAEGPLRFTELKREVNGVSQRMLTETVRSLERDGVLLRTVYPSIPPKVEYSLTELGSSLVVPVQALVGWALDNRADIIRARDRYDLKSSEPIQAVPSELPEVRRGYLSKG